MTEPSSSSPPIAMAPMTLEPSPLASSADTPPTGYFLPGNPLPYLAPSAIHQPELLLLAWMLHSSVTPSHILLPSPTNKPTGSIYNFATLSATWEPSMLTFAGAFASFSFCLAHQDRQAIIEWTHQLLSHPPPPAISSLHHLPPLSTPTSSPPQHSLITHLIPRDRLRSRDRQPPNNTSASPHNPNLYISSRQPLSDITPSPNHRSQPHQSLWTATTTSPNTSSSTPSASWTMTPQRAPTDHPY